VHAPALNLDGPFTTGTHRIGHSSLCKADRRTYGITGTRPTAQHRGQASHCNRQYVHKIFFIIINIL
jgi:hypothetical protein